MEPRPGIHPVRAVGHDVVGVGQRRDELDPHHGLFRATHGWLAEVGRGRRPLHRVRLGPGVVPIFDHDAVRRAGGGRFEAHLRERRIRPEERETDAGVPTGLRGIAHLLGPVLIVGDREQRLVGQQFVDAIGVQVEIGRVRHVVARALEPPEDIDVPRDEVAQPRVRHRAIEGHLHRRGVPGDGVRAVAVEAIEALPGAPVVGIVVIRLVGHEGGLVQERCRATVLDHEYHVVLVPLRIRELGGIDAARPIARDGQRVARIPVALE